MASREFWSLVQARWEPWQLYMLLGEEIMLRYMICETVTFKDHFMNLTFGSHASCLLLRYHFLTPDELLLFS